MAGERADGQREQNNSGSWDLPIFTHTLPLLPPLSSGVKRPGKAAAAAVVRKGGGKVAAHGVSFSHTHTTATVLAFV